MRILVVGSGGREHALAWKLSQEAEVYASPGNPGIAEDCEVLSVGLGDTDGLIKAARDLSVDLVVVGPEDPLIHGLGNALREAGLTVFGPNRDAAQLEGSKAFSKDMMQKAGVPTAPFSTFTDLGEAKGYATRRFGEGRKVVVKASGNALGKGVIVTDSVEEAHDALERMMGGHEFGTAGDTVVIEDRLSGREFSLLTIVGDHNYVSLPVAQDHKRALDGDLGPNTGGMGTYSPVSWLEVDLVSQVEDQVAWPIISRMKREGMPFRGTLFSGVMVDSGVPYCLEYNVRFGDPETQSVLSRLGSGFAEALYQSAAGEMIVAPDVKPNAAVTVVVASGGYPGSYAKGVPIRIGRLPAGVKVFHAGTAVENGRLVTAGGRVLAVTATAASLADARRLAYEGVKAVEFEGMQYRTDIAAAAQ